MTADLESPDLLAVSLAVHVPADWPPDLFEAQAVRYMRDWLHAHPQHADWGLYYLVLQDGAIAPDPAGPVLIGGGGFKGPPDEAGLVEVGYSILARYQGQGLATEAVLGWLRFAFGVAEVSGVIAQTLPSLVPSIRVLEKAGFSFEGRGDDPDVPESETVLRYGLHRPQWRADAARSA